MTIYKWVKSYMKAIWELISLWAFHTQKNLIRRSSFLYVISVNYLLISLYLAIFLLLHQRKSTWYNSKWTDITYCLLPQTPHYQSLLAKSLGERVASLLYSLCTCGTVEHIKLMHSQGTQRLLGTIYAFMGIVFVLIINLFSLVIDSHKAHLLLSWDE